MVKLKIVLLFLMLFLIGLPFYAQELDHKQLKFLKKNAQEIQIDNNGDILRLSSLNKALKNKRIVLLGEFTHGAKEINLVKNGVIKYLHEQLGYKVLLFESGVGELMSLELDRAENTPRQLLGMGLFGPWRTQEYLELMTYLKENETLKVGGFDVQRSGQAFAKYLKECLKLANPEMNDEVLGVEDDFSDFNSYMRNNKMDDDMINQRDKLVHSYQQVYEKIAQSESLKASKDIPPIQVALILKTIENRVAYINYFMQFKKDNDYGKRWAARDSIMASNIIWFAEHIYPNDKIIINAHNFHIAKYNEKELVMGEVLFEKYPNDFYSIGIFGGEGVLANNSRKPEKLTPPTEINDIKRFVQNSPAENTFLSIPKTSKKGGEWLEQEVIVNDSFLDLYGGKTLVPAKCYDGLIFIKKITLPAFL